MFLMRTIEDSEFVGKNLSRRYLHSNRNVFCNEDPQPPWGCGWGSRVRAMGSCAARDTTARIYAVNLDGPDSTEGTFEAQYCKNTSAVPTDLLHAR